MTYNVHSLRYAGKPQEVDPELLADIASERNCDLLCLQEAPNYKERLSRLTEVLSAQTRLKYRYSDSNGHFAFFSAYPILDAETHYFPNRTNGYQCVDAHLGNAVVRIFNVHLQSNAVSQIAERVASQGNLKEKQTWLDLRGMMARFGRSARQRALQAEELADLVAQSPYPVLLVGDLNDTPHSYTWRTLTRALRDTYTVKGRGLGITYAGRIPGLRIDYILAGKAFDVLAHQTEKKGFSDHRAVWCKVALEDVPNRIAE